MLLPLYAIDTDLLIRDTMLTSALVNLNYTLDSKSSV